MNQVGVFLSLCISLLFAPYSFYAIDDTFNLFYTRNNEVITTSNSFFGSWPKQLTVGVVLLFQANVSNCCCPIGTNVLNTFSRVFKKASTWPSNGIVTSTIETELSRCQTTKSSLKSPGESLILLKVYVTNCIWQESCCASVTDLLWCHWLHL